MIENYQWQPMDTAPLATKENPVLLLYPPARSTSVLRKVW